jgi:hypothetical protein
MIIMTQKPFEKIVEMSKDFHTLFLVGCGECATTCQAGGEEQVKAMIEKLKAVGKEISGYAVIEAACDQRLVRRDLRKNEGAVKASEAMLVLTCGSGVQTVMEISNKISIPGCDTKFLGTVEKIGRFYERCRACGDCVLFETGGICPIARCSKSILNGPCGGQNKGKCEVGGWKNDCAWILIYNRLKELNKLSDFKKFRPPKDYSLMAQWREIVWR